MNSQSPIADSQGRDYGTTGLRDMQDHGRLRTLNPTCFINRAAVRDFLLEQARTTRAHKFERVSSETLRDANEALRSWLLGHVRRLPSKGKTI